MRRNHRCHPPRLEQTHRRTGRRQTKARVSYSDAACIGRENYQGLTVGYWSNGYYYLNRLEYVGHGPVAELAEMLDAAALQARRIRNQARESEQVERQAFQAARAMAGRVDALVKIGLEAAGYHRLRRHHWRRRRAMETQIQSEATARATFELSELVEASYVSAISGKSAAIADELQRKLATLRAELIGPDPSPSLKLAVAAAVHAWLDHWTVELIAARDPGNVTPTIERRRTWSSRRYGQALVTCERIRRLSKPRSPRVAIQVNQMIAPSPCLAVTSNG